MRRCKGERPHGRSPPRNRKRRCRGNCHAPEGHNPSRDWPQLRKILTRQKQNRHWIEISTSAAEYRDAPALEKESRASAAASRNRRSRHSQKAASEWGLSKIEDLYAAVGFGKYSARQVLTKVLGESAKPADSNVDDTKPTLVKTVKRMLGLGEAPLVVKGHDDLLVFRAKCCNPIPGDEIVGYITRGRGVAVHTRACPNVQNSLYQAERRIAVEWGGASAATFPVQLAIRAKDRAGLLAEITAVISAAGSNIRNLESRPDRLNARIEASLEIADRRQLESILANIRKISGVQGVERVYQPTGD